MFFLVAVPTPTRRIGPLVDLALRRCGMTHKEAALNAHVDFAEWSRALHGKARLDWDWLAAQPWRFQAAFIPLYMEAITTELIEDWKPRVDLSGPMKMARASIHDHEQQREDEKRRA